MADILYPKVKLTDEEVLAIIDSNGNITELVEYDGYYLSKNSICEGHFSDPRTNIPNIINMKTRPNDVFVIAYPKSGTHWTCELVHMLLKGVAEYNRHPQVKSTIPFHTPEVLDKLPSPRVINSPMFFRHLPQDSMLRNRNKIIFVKRNPKDIAVSFYHHCQYVSLQYKGSWEDFLQFFMSDQVYHSPWHFYMLDWENVIKDNPDLELLVVNYEDLTQDLVKEIEKIAAFLGVTHMEPQLYKMIAEKCSFQALKQDYKRRDHLSGTVAFRTGGVGGWKDWFTVAQNEQFEKYLKEKMQHSSWKFLYELP